jgi:uncharacterized membrane protein
MSWSRKNIMLLAVVCSVALNLFFVGALAARYLDRAQRPVEPPTMRWLMRDLESATRERLQPQMGSYAETLRPLRGEMFRAQRRVNALLAAEPLNQQAVEQAFVRLREANLRYQALSHQQLVQVLAQLSGEQRVRAMRFMSDRRSPDGGRGNNRDTGGNLTRDARPAADNN